jgi:hypothetical protein
MHPRPSVQCDPCCSIVALSEHLSLRKDPNGICFSSWSVVQDRTVRHEVWIVLEQIAWNLWISAKHDLVRTSPMYTEKHIVRLDSKVDTLEPFLVIRWLRLCQYSSQPILEVLAADFCSP